jgi:ADP-heptose:LPS heptosyltransferase
VVDLGFLGDSIHLVPALWELKRNYPQALLHTLSATVGAELLSLAPCVNKAWAFPLAAPSPPWWRHWDLLGSLRREGFDAAFNFSGADRTIFITALTGAKHRVAHAAGREHFWQSWLINDWVPRRPNTLPVYEQRRQVLAACGLSLANANWELRLPDTVRMEVESLVPEDAIHFSINASTPLKEWPLEHWTGLARELLAGDSGCRIIASGSRSPREQERLRAFAAAVYNSRLTIVPESWGVAQLAAALRRCRLHVGGDSGVLHLAVAMGLPTVAIFRDYAGKDEWLPQGPEHRHVIADCPCTGLHQPPCLTENRARCLEQIAPGQVFALVRELMHTPARANA